MPRFKLYDPPPPERHGCPVTGKRMFESAREAQWEADRIRNDGGASLAIYQCMSCSHWHFTSAIREVGI